MVKMLYYSSRSSTECADHCLRHRFLEYHYAGRGLTLKAVNFPLVVGTEVHAAIAFILQSVKDVGKQKFANEVGETVLEEAIAKVYQAYGEKVARLGYFDAQGRITNRELEFTYNEQRALVEALIRTWAFVELPRIFKRYEILEVEQEYMEVFSSNAVFTVQNFGCEVPVISYQGTPDAIFKDLSTRDLLVYSLKTSKIYDDRTRKGYEHDLQGITESWLVEMEMGQRNESLMEAAKALGSSNVAGWEQAVEWIGSKQWPTRVMGQQMCYLIKGLRRKRQDDSVTYEDGAHPEQEFTASPLVRGYRKHNPDGTLFAHSMYFPNAENKSGWGRLGKGWEPFNVWENEQVGGVKGWIGMLASNEIQPECGDILRSQVVTPPEYFRTGMDLEGTINEVMAKERDIVRRLGETEQRLGYPIADMKNLADPNALTVLQEMFPRSRRACHYPTDCAMLNVCFNRRVAERPLEHGQEGVPQYELRTPHHAAELKSLEGR